MVWLSTKENLTLLVIALFSLTQGTKVNFSFYFSICINQHFLIKVIIYNMGLYTHGQRMNDKVFLEIQSINLEKLHYFSSVVY